MRDQVKLLFFWISDSCSQFIFYLIHASKVRTTRDNKSAKKITHCNHLKSRKGCAKQNHGSFTSVTPWPGGGTVVLRFPASCTWKILKKNNNKKTMRKSQDGKCLSGCPPPSVCGVAVKPSVFLDCQCLSVRVSARS